MSRSWKKPWVWVSSRITKQNKRAYRHALKQKCHEVEIDFDPDKDFEELKTNRKLYGEWGTRFGFELPPNENEDTWIHREYKRIQRK